jgi:hypothetical protein
MSESDPKPSLHIDTDWKKQAQEEKRRLAEAEKQKAEAASASSAATAPSGAAGAGTTDRGGNGGAPRGAASATTAPSGATAGARGQARELPPPSFATLVQSLVTQALFYLGDLAPRGSEPTLNLDMAKHQIDMLGVLEEKTTNNLAPEEKQLLDAALYETRMRYISVASQFLGP